MPKVPVFSPAPIPRKQNFRTGPYKHWWPLAIRSKLTLFRQRKRKRLNNSPHRCAMLTLSSPALVIGSIPSAWHSGIPFAKASVEERANALHGDTDPNPRRWSPTVPHKRKKSPPRISLQSSSRQTLLQIEDQPNAFQLSSSGQDKDSSKPPNNEAICLQQPRLQSDSATLREWTACIIFGFALRVDRRGLRPPMHVVFLSLNTHNLSECCLGVLRRWPRLLRTLNASLRPIHPMTNWFF